MLPFFLPKVRPPIIKAIGLEHAQWDSAQLLLVTGNNASGKSVFRRLCQSFLRDEGEVIHLSQQGRAKGGIERVFIYGNEEDEATGIISANCLIKAFRTSRGREKPHILVFDEPEIGMGEEAQIGAATFIKEQFDDIPKHLMGIVIMTHSRHVVTILKDVPHCGFIHLGNTYKTADEWLSRPLVPLSPQQLTKNGIDKWHEVSAALKR